MRTIKTLDIKIQGGRFFNQNVKKHFTKKSVKHFLLF